MPASQSADFFHQNVNSYIALAFVGSLALLAGLSMVHVAFGYDPTVEMFMNQNAAVHATLNEK